MKFAAALALLTIASATAFSLSPITRFAPAAQISFT